MKRFVVRLADGKAFVVKADRFVRPQMAIYVTNEITETEECVATFNLNKLEFIADIKYLSPGFAENL